MRRSGDAPTAVACWIYLLAFQLYSPDVSPSSLGFVAIETFITAAFVAEIVLKLVAMGSVRVSPLWLFPFTSQLSAFTMPPPFVISTSLSPLRSLRFASISRVLPLRPQQKFWAWWWNRLDVIVLVLCIIAFVWYTYVHEYGGADQFGGDVRDTVGSFHGSIFVLQRTLMCVSCTSKPVDCAVP